MFGNGDQLMKHVVWKLPGRMHFLTRVYWYQSRLARITSSTLGCVRVHRGRRPMQELQTANSQLQDGSGWGAN
jgi:hypothetical protein